jgi:competence protein ComGC
MFALMRSRVGFTLVEICVSMAIGLLLLGMAVPSVVGLVSERQLMGRLEEFEGLVQRAQLWSVSERRSFVLAWERDGVVLRPEDPLESEADRSWPRMEFLKGETLELGRPVALEKKPAPRWTFWRSGTCEPVRVRYQGRAGQWQADYDPLTCRRSSMEHKIN